MICEAIGWDYRQADKIDHAAGGALIGGISMLSVNHLWPQEPAPVRLVQAIIPVLIVAVGKEVYDHQHPDRHTSDWKDAAATIGGGAIAIRICLRW